MPHTLLRTVYMEMVKSSFQETHFPTGLTEGKATAMPIEAQSATGTCGKKQITLMGFRKVA